MSDIMKIDLLEESVLQEYTQEKSIVGARIDATPYIDNKFVAPKTLTIVMSDYQYYVGEYTISKDVYRHILQMERRLQEQGKIDYNFKWRA